MGQAGGTREAGPAAPDLLFTGTTLGEGVGQIRSYLKEKWKA